MNKVIYEIQDLVIRKELTSYEKFKIHFQDEVKFDKKLRNYKFINDLFKNIYTFLKVLQGNPKSIILVQAMKPMFEMLLFEMIIPDSINVFLMGSCEILYNVDLTKPYQGYGLKLKKRLPQIKYNLFVNHNIWRYWPLILEGGGVNSWMRKQRIKRVKTIGVEAFTKEHKERIERVREKFINWRKQLNENDADNLKKKFHYADKINNREEYKDYLKYSGCDSNEYWLIQYEEFEKKYVEKLFC